MLPAPVTAACRDNHKTFEFLQLVVQNLALLHLKAVLGCQLLRGLLNNGGGPLHDAVTRVVQHCVHVRRQRLGHVLPQCLLLRPQRLQLKSRPRPSPLCSLPHAVQRRIRLGNLMLQLVNLAVAIHQHGLELAASAQHVQLLVLPAVSTGGREKALTSDARRAS